MKIKFAKLRNNTIIPTKRKEDAGFDLYAAPTQEWINEHCIEKDGEVLIHFVKHSIIMIPIGISTEFDSDYVAIVKERGSTGTKGLCVRCGVIDSGYRGEWNVVIMANDDIDYPLKKAIAQVVMIRCEDSVWEENELAESERGSGAWGSSGK